MTGKIESSVVAQMTNSPQSVQAGKAGAAGHARVGAVSEADVVTLSGQGANLNELVDVAQQTPDIDVKKVAAIREALAAGTYQVNAESVATKMAHMEWQMGRS
ncbi:MAG: flagellar biosynthesis anti-sigma factor FlgM [Abyssibacter sp.]|uniref:flagellar biosynthesis anti-sigma factor FlgM n=1 Tax=Abyssibacter sp. TaxID=2320200 RepID=UPI002E990F08|nr:flagellar biosynthesis anti-sigma factor FlgM [Pseudomonadota bacterium]